MLIAVETDYAYHSSHSIQELRGKDSRQTVTEAISLIHRNMCIAVPLFDQPIEGVCYYVVTIHKFHMLDYTSINYAIFPLLGLFPATEIDSLIIHYFD